MIASLYQECIVKLNRRKAADKFAVLFNLNQEIAKEISESTQFVVNKYGRIKNVLSATGSHLASFRLGDRVCTTLTNGSNPNYSLEAGTIPKSFTDSQYLLGCHSGEGLAGSVDDDAESFVEKCASISTFYQSL